MPLSFCQISKSLHVNKQYGFFFIFNKNILLIRLVENVKMNCIFKALRQNLRRLPINPYSRCINVTKSPSLTTVLIAFERENYWKNYWKLLFNGRRFPYGIFAASVLSVAYCDSFDLPSRQEKRFFKAVQFGLTHEVSK